MPTTNSDIRDYVSIRPMPSISHVGLKVTARCSTPVYTCESPSRHEVAKQNFERRDHQIHYCGYRSVNFKPYKEVGEVILDERELILRALGQYTGNVQGQEEDSSSSGWLKQLHTNVNEAKDAIALVQPKLDNLQTLNGQLGKGRLLLNKVKLGIDLFRLIREEQKRKAFASERARIEHEHESKTSMRAAGDLYDLFNDEDETIDISKYIVSPFGSQRSKAGSHVGSFINVSQLNSDGNDHYQDGIAGEDTRIEAHGMVASTDELELTNSNKEIAYSRTTKNNEPMKIAHGFHRLNPMLHSNKTAKSKFSTSKKYRTHLPRPFSPVFTNVNFYETQSVQHTFRQLCALHWILEAMSLDQPASMPPISTCWKLTELKQDITSAQRKADREKAVEPIWRAFLSNPKRFTRAKTGKRGTLLQRRISVAPSALRKMSSASNVSQLSGSKMSSVGEDFRASSGTPSASNKQGSNSRRYSRAESRAGDDSPSSRTPVQTKKISVSKMDASPLQPSPISSPKAKEKAFIVRDVVIAKSAFVRKESRASKRGSSLSRGLQKLGSKKGEKTSGGSEKFNVHKEEREKLSSEPKGTAASTRRHSLSSPSATTEQISQNTDDEKVPMNLKEMFDELATENALDLHDKLEQREKKRMESMERKFHALRVMNDVHRALSVMRSKSRLKVETDEEKKARFTEECSWYKSLLENLPSEVRDDNYNALVLDKIAKYGSLEGRKISNTHFIKVLSTLRPWELCYPDISAAIEFVRDKVVEMDKHEFEAWFQSRVGEQQHLEMSFNKSDA